jgi:ribosomal protein L7Ae-like RNA K-turn-binding protein
VLGLLGLARRAGAVSIGVAETRRLLEAGRLRAVLFAADASEVQVDKVRGLARGRNVPLRRVVGKDGLGRALGSGPVSVVGIREGAFAERLLSRIGSDGAGPDEEGEITNEREESK